MAHNHKRELFNWSVWTICLFGLSLQLLNNQKQMSEYKVFSSAQMVDDESIPTPSVSICPFPPWNIDKLIAAGLNVSCMYIQDCIFDHLHGMLGYWNQSEPFSLSDVSLVLDDIVANVSLFGGPTSAEVDWQTTSFATLNCFTWSPESDIDEHADNIMDISFTSDKSLASCWSMTYLSCEETEINCGISCESRFKYLITQNKIDLFYVFLHPKEELPTPGDNQPTLLIAKGNSMEVELQYEMQIKESTPVDPCIDSMSFSKCLRNCMDDVVLQKNNCSMNKKAGLTCDDVSSWWSLWNDEKLIIDRKSPEIIQNCNCGQSCHKRLYSVTKAGSSQGSEVTQLSIKMGSTIFWKVVEYRAYTMSSFLADLGGAAGIWLGISGLSASLALLGHAGRALSR